MLKKFFAAACVSVVLLSGCAVTDGGYNVMRPPKTQPFQYEMITLDNGLKVISLEDNSTPIVAVQLWYKVGSRNEEAKRHGFAHMFEHMMFQGTQLLSNSDHFTYLRKVGGDTNAYTSFDNTTYLDNAPSNQLEMLLWLEGERMGFLKIDDKAFATERKVVEEELRNGREAPYGEVAEKLLAEMFPVAPYGWSPGGSIEHLRASTSADLQKFWETYYVPNNATLVVAGAVTHKQVQELADKYLGWIPAGPLPAQPEQKEAEQTAPKKITIKERLGPIPAVAIGVHTEGVASDDSIPLEMFSLILGGGESSRLQKRLVNDEKSAVAAAAGSFGFVSEGLAGTFALQNPLSTKGDLDSIRKSMEEELNRMRDEGPTDEEIVKARNNMLRSEITQLLTVSSKASALGNAAVLEGDVSRVNSKIDRIRAVTSEDIKRVGKKYFADQRKNYITIEPDLFGGLMSKVAGKGFDNEEAPVLESPSGAVLGNGKPGLKRPDWWGDKPPVKPIDTTGVKYDIVEKTLGNGLKVVVIPNKEVPFVTMTLGVMTGAFNEPANMPGTASTAASLVTKGTENFTAEELAEELDRNAIDLGAGVGMDTGTVSASAVKEMAPKAMELMAEVVRRPTFPEDEFKKLIDQEKTGKQIGEKQPAYLAERELRKAIYQSHPFAREADGELKDIDKLKPEAIKEWWKKNLRPDNTVLYVAGDITPEDAQKLAETSFGTWKSEGDGPVKTIPAIPAPGKTKIILVNKSGATQSQIRMGHNTAGRAAENYFDVRQMSSIFGGGFDSRLNKEIRVKKGLTYGAGGGISASRFTGDFRVSTFSKTDTTVETVKAVLEEIDKMKAAPPTAEELENSVNATIGGYPSGQETPQEIVAQQWLLTYSNLPQSYFDDYLAAVKKMTPDDILKAAQAMKREELQIVVVGDAKKLKKGLEEIGEVKVVSGE